MAGSRAAQQLPCWRNPGPARAKLPTAEHGTPGPPAGTDACSRSWSLPCGSRLSGIARPARAFCSGCFGVLPRGRCDGAAGFCTNGAQTEQGEAISKMACGSSTSHHLTRLVARQFWKRADVAQGKAGGDVARLQAAVWRHGLRMVGHCTDNGHTQAESGAAGLLTTRPRRNVTSAPRGGAHLLQRRGLSVWPSGRRPSEKAVQSLHTEACHELCALVCSLLLGGRDHCVDNEEWNARAAWAVLQTAVHPQSDAAGICTAHSMKHPPAANMLISVCASISEPEAAWAHRSAECGPCRPARGSPELV